MSHTTSPWRWTFTLVLLLLVAMAIVSQAPAAPVVPPPLVPGSSTYGVIQPNDASPNKAGQTLTIKATYPDPADPTKALTVDVKVPGIAKYPAKVGETTKEASLRKAEAIKAAFDAAKIPVKTTVVPTQIPVWDGKSTLPNPFFHAPNLIHNPQTLFTHTLFNHTSKVVPDHSKTVMVPNGFWSVKYDGITYETDAKTGEKKGGVTLVTDPTKQGSGIMNFTPGKGDSTPSHRPSSSGSSSSMGLSSGLDPLGEPSIVSFGFYDDLGGTIPDPKLYIASILPLEGMEESEVMEQLAWNFNYEFGPSYSLQYDEYNRTLFLNQELGWNNTFYFGNSDTGLDLSFEMTAVPEPSTLALAFVSLVCLSSWGLGAWGIGTRRMK